MTLGQSCNSNDVKDVLEVENDFIKANLKIESIDGEDINFTITVEALQELILKNVTAEYYEVRPVKDDHAKLTDIELAESDYDMPLNEPESVDAKFTVSKIKDSQYIRVYIKYEEKESGEEKEIELFKTMKE